GADQKAQAGAAGGAEKFAFVHLPSSEEGPLPAVQRDDWRHLLERRGGLTAVHVTPVWIVHLLANEERRNRGGKQIGDTHGREAEPDRIRRGNDPDERRTDCRAYPAEIVRAAHR